MAMHGPLDVAYKLKFCLDRAEPHLEAPVETRSLGDLITGIVAENDFGVDAAHAVAAQNGEHLPDRLVRYSRLDIRENKKFVAGKPDGKIAGKALPRPTLLSTTRTCG